MYLIFRVAGGAGVDFRLEFNKMESKINKPFVSTAPPYRIVGKGLNLEAECNNKGCEAFGKKTWVHKGFKHFNIAKEISKCNCPLCGKITLPAVNVGYYMT